MARIELTHDAQRDLIEIYLYGVEHFGLPQAERYAQLLEAAMETAARNPSFGSDYSFVRGARADRLRSDSQSDPV